MQVDHYGFYLNPSETVLFRFSPLGEKTFLEIVLGAGENKKTIVTGITAPVLNRFRVTINRARNKLYLNRDISIPGELVEGIRLKVDADGSLLLEHNGVFYTALSGNRDTTHLRMGMLTDMVDSIIHGDPKHTRHLTHAFHHADKYMSETVEANGVRIQLHHNLNSGYTVLYGTKHGNFFFPFNSIGGGPNAELVMDIFACMAYLSHGEIPTKEYVFSNYTVKGLGPDDYDDRHISISRTTKEGGPSTMLVKVGSVEYRLLMKALCSVIEIEMARRQYDPTQVGGGRQRKWEKIQTSMERIKRLYTAPAGHSIVRRNLLNGIEQGSTEELIEQLHSVYLKTRLER